MPCADMRAAARESAAEEARHDADIAAKLAKNLRIGEERKVFKAAREAELAAIKEREEAIDERLHELKVREGAVAAQMARFRPLFDTARWE